MFLMQNQRKKLPVSYFERARQQFCQGKILVSSDVKVGRCCCCCCSPSFRTIFFYLKRCMKSYISIKKNFKIALFLSFLSLFFKWCYFCCRITLLLFLKMYRNFKNHPHCGRNHFCFS